MVPSTRHRMLAAGVLLLTLPVLAALRLDWSAATVARLVLGLAAAGAGVALWVRTRRPLPAGFRAAPRLVVVQRVGLSPRAGMALVELDGRPFLVVHGDGYAEVRRAPRPVVVKP